MREGYQFGIGAPRSPCLRLDRTPSFGLGELGGARAEDGFAAEALIAISGSGDLEEVTGSGPMVADPPAASSSTSTSD